MEWEVEPVPFCESEGTGAQLSPKKIPVLRSNSGYGLGIGQK